MALRIYAEQNVHDEVVRGLASIYTDRGFQTCKNENQQKNMDFNGLYPDVIVRLKGENKYWLFEVETESSITSKEAEQWKQYGQTFPFFLMVPSSMVAQAQVLISENNIQNVNLRQYEHNSRGGQTFYGLPGIE